MRRESGVSIVAVVAVLAVAAAAGAGFLAWRSTTQLDRVQNDLSATQSNLEKARSEVRKVQQELATASNQAKELKVVADRLTAERDGVRASIENEQATGVRLRAELELAKDQINYLASRSTKEIVRGMPKTAAPR
jgi:septal ring factor EnvC (AmiA/AmiB activator)